MRRNPDDFSDEVRAHLQHEEAELRVAGMTAEDARAEARRRFGNPTRAIEDVRDGHPLRLLETLWQDVKYGVRLMRRSPAFSITAILVLSLGIGVNTALFSIVNALFFKPLPVQAPEELFYVYTKGSGQRAEAFVDPSFFEFFFERGAGLADYTGHWRVQLRLSADNETDFVYGEWVDTNYFEFLGVAMSLGRPFGPQDADPANPEQALVISHDLWTRRFHADPGILGTQVRLNETFVTIVGVAEPGFEGLSDPWTPSHYWAPGTRMQGALSGLSLSAPRRYVGGPIGRLKPGVTFEQVQTFFATIVPEWTEGQLDRLRARMSGADYERWSGSIRARQFPLYRAVDTRMPFDPESRLIPPNLLAGLVAVVALVLLIAAANIAGLLLARGVTRTGEVAVRRALGAGGARVSRQLLTESVLLATAGGALGLAVATTLVGLFRAYTPSQYVVDVSVDWRVLLFAVAVCVGAGIVVGLAPALQAARVNVLEALGSGIVGARVVRTRLRHWIVIPQVALSLVLLLVAAVHVRALMRFELADLGYRTDGAIVLTIGRWEPREPIATQSQRTREEAQRAPAARVRLFNRAVLDRVASLPQVTSAAIAASLPVYSTTSELTPVVPRDDYDAGGPPRGAATRAVVSDGYFDAMGMRLLAGRRFDDRDGPYEQFGPRVAVVSEALARRLWPAGNAVGGSLAFLSDSPGQRPEWLEVVGVVNEVDPILDDVGERPQVYVPLKQEWRGSARHLVVRGAGDQAALIGDLKAAVVGADAFAEVSQVRTMEQVVGEILYPRRLAAAILTAAGGIGLLLACIGLYGVVSYSVAQRLREIGIRTTLGAERGDIVALVLREGAKVAGIGIAAGLGLAWVALRWSAGIVPDVPVMDVVSFTVVPAVLAGVVIAASVVPARRAARVDPAQVLRTG